MLSVGIDAALKAHQGEIQSDDGKVHWKGKLENNKEGLDKLIANIEKVEKK